VLPEPVAQKHCRYHTEHHITEALRQVPKLAILSLECILFSLEFLKEPNKISNKFIIANRAQFNSIFFQGKSAVQIEFELNPQRDLNSEES